MPEKSVRNFSRGFDSEDHQASYIYCPLNAIDNTSKRPSKRRKTVNHPHTSQIPGETEIFGFSPLLGGLESTYSTKLRRQLFEESWAATDMRIQRVLNAANEDTLEAVSVFVHNTRNIVDEEHIPAGFIITGPNIASQELLFKQLCSRLRSESNGPVVVLRSADASNLKAVLKHVIRDATRSHVFNGIDEEVLFEGRKLLNYDLDLLFNFVKAQESSTVIVAFQDSEAFDTILLAEIITLFNSWKDRIPFVLIFGIATSVDLFHERLSRATSRCLSGPQFEAEHTNSLLERIFQQAVAGAKAPLRLSPDFIAILMERQEDHIQSIQAFVAAIKYAYMCHYYYDALSVLNIHGKAKPLSEFLQPEHFEAIRVLPSFHGLVESKVRGARSKKQLLRVRSLLADNRALLDEIQNSLAAKDILVGRLLRSSHLLSSALPEPLPKIDLYLAAAKGNLVKSRFVQDFLDSVKQMAPEDIISLQNEIKLAIINGAPEIDLAGWPDEDSVFQSELSDIRIKLSTLVEKCTKAGKPLRSSCAIHSKGFRTTVVAQRVHLSHEKLTLSNEDIEFTSLVDRFSQLLVDYFSVGDLQDNFLSEVWTFDSWQRHREVFVPRPRTAIERALSVPHDYLKCICCKSVEGLSASNPATAILYQMCLESGSLINMFDLWKTYSDLLNGDGQGNCDDRDNLVCFYQALADLKSLGIVKPSKRKADHLAKVTWKGL